MSYKTLNNSALGDFCVCDGILIAHKGAATKKSNGVKSMFLDKVIFNKTKVPVLNAVLDVTQLRQRVIANNIANVSTKGYRKQDVQFQEYLESFVRQPAVEGKMSDGRHIPIPKPIAGPLVYEPESGVNDSGLNNVDIDREMADLAENHLFFNIGQRLIRGSFDGLKKAISGRVG
ncbi:MAG: flagellar basal-body rod protein FlgB [Candidatus Latescibacterota bacterium]|jgi:flagellar basal-body rod protein FlgB